MQARLGVITCDNCGEPMEKGQNVLIVAEGAIAKAGDKLDFQSGCPGWQQSTSEGW